MGRLVLIVDALIVDALIVDALIVVAPVLGGSRESPSPPPDCRIHPEFRCRFGHDGRIMPTQGEQQC
ncbi:hypothetical protein ACWGN5_25660 [Streptomyces sp. NPDC055815]